MFQPYKSDNGAVLPWEYLEAEAGDYAAGQLLNTDATTGSLEAISAGLTTTPPYLCMGQAVIEEGGERVLPVTRIAGDVIYETELAQAVTGLAVGMKLQVAGGGLGVSKPATGSGTFEVVSFEGKAAGDTVYGRFL